MITIAIFGVLGAFAGYMILRPHNNGLGIALLGMAGSVLGIGVSLALGGVFADRSDFKKTTETVVLVSLNNSTSASGEFFLGSGSVQGQKRYYYMTETEKGIASRSVEARDAYIVETDTTSPKIVRHKFNGKLQLWYIPVIKRPSEVENYDRVYVPEGSIKNQFKPND
jgi:hypothetical protein